MRTLSFLLLIGFSFPVLACDSVPFVRLLANPTLYSGKCVETVGVLSVEFEGLRIYSDRESYEYGVYENSVRHTFYPDVNSEINTEETFKRFSQAFEGKLVRYKGKFSHKDEFTRFPSPTGIFIVHEDVSVLDKWMRNINLKKSSNRIHNKSMKKGT